MSQKVTISVYFTIIRKLRGGNYSFESILKYIDNESLTGDVFEMSKRTFQRYIKDIHDIFNIEIKFNKLRGTYFIAADDTGIQNRIFETFDLFHALKYKEQLTKYVQLESKEIQNTHYIPVFINAIKNNLTTTFTYCKFRDNANTLREVEPYLLKEYHNRWFVLAKDKKDNMLKTYAMDRIIELPKTTNHFNKNANINALTYFEHSIGIITPNQTESQNPQKVVMKVNDFQKKYLESLPLHKSQTITTNENGENILTLTVFITHDLEMEILSLGENVIVMEPQSLVNTMKIRIKKTINNYK